MVPDKFNMVDMDGIDLIMMQGEEVPGLYNRLVESIAQCRYQCLYNWFFNGVVIPPSYVEMEVNEDEEVAINEGVTVSSDDVIHIYSLGPSPVDPDIIPLLAEENGVYNVPAGKDGFNPVTVNVPSYTPIIQALNVTENGTYTAPTGVDGFNPISVNVPTGEVEPDLPSEYQRVEYLDFSPDGGIIVTLPTGYGLYTVKVSLDSLHNPSTFFGYRVTSTSIYDFQFKYNASVITTWFRDPSGGAIAQDPISNIVTGEIYSLTGLLDVHITNALVGKYARYSSSGVNGDCLDGKFYELKAQDLSDFTTKCWMVPCYRKSDNKPGVYDHKANAFYYEVYSPLGTYSITPGPDIN